MKPGLWDKLKLSPIKFDPAEIAHRFWRFDALAERFNSRRSDDLVKAPNVRIVLHANVVGLRATENASMIAAPGRQVPCRAKNCRSMHTISYSPVARLKMPGCC